MPKRYLKVQRRLHTTWKDTRGPNWTRRGRIYEAPKGVDWRVNIEDTHRGIDLFVPNEDEAFILLTKFEAGATVVELREEYRESN